jgi:phosphoribosylaminoimidazolecarboxamide formyltransferase / IMP cyclohydrolase
MSGQEIRKIYRTARVEEFPSQLTISLGGRTYDYSKVQWTIDGKPHGLRYGSNPHQKAALYKPRESTRGIGSVEWVKWGKDGPSATNLEDGSHGLRIVNYFREPAVAVMKHLNPSGVASATPGESLQSMYVRARDADPRAAFGSVVVFNAKVDTDMAKEITDTFVEIVYAPEYESSALQIFDAKKDLRIGKVAMHDASEQATPDIIVLEDGSLVLEDSYSTGLKSLEQLKNLAIPTKRSPSNEEYLDLLHAWWVACEVRSNAVIFWKNGLSLAIGTGQQDRIGAIENCIDKARRAGHSLKGSVMASDGFLPKMDNIEAVASEGVTAIIQPGGSIEDRALLQACDLRGIAMIFTGERSFRHF